MNLFNPIRRFMFYDEEQTQVLKLKAVDLMLALYTEHQTSDNVKSFSIYPSGLILICSVCVVHRQAVSPCENHKKNFFHQIASNAAVAAEGLVHMIFLLKVLLFMISWSVETVDVTVNIYE